MWGIDSVCDLHSRVSRRDGDLRQIEFTCDGRWGILGVRENEENAPQFQRTGKTAAGASVFGGGDALVGDCLGRRIAGCGRGVLRWGNVPVAWSWARTGAKVEWHQYREGHADRRLRPSCADR